MSAPFDTLLLDLTNWDLTLDAQGNIAVASAPYALAQDVASAVKTFSGEVYYDATLGVPYETQILGRRPPLSIFKQDMVDAALTVPGVVSARCVLESFADRTVTGQITFTDVNHVTQTVGL